MGDIFDIHRYYNKKDLGKAGEAIAVRYLVGLGYTILARNHSSPLGELDIVADDGGVLVFVEVKTRISGIFGEPEEYIDRKKRYKLTKLAQLYIKNNKLYHMKARFDVIAICGRNGVGEKTIKLIKHAFYAEE
ncbi:MAG: YraN family protein [Candidatus Omnitrophica bacterium]|nr:YraN family protein [Candidatus Omnitrophota bacterium]